MDELQISGKRFISSRRIARDNGYTSDYIGQLIRGGKVVGQKVGRAWYVDAESFDIYLSGEGIEAPVQVASQKSSDLLSELKGSAGQTFAQQPTPTPEVVAPVAVLEEVAAEIIPEIIEEKVDPIVVAVEPEIKKEPELVVVAIKKEEAAVVVVEAPHHVPLHIIKKEEAPKRTEGGLHYYADDAPSLPEIRKDITQSRIVEVEEGSTEEIKVTNTARPSHRARTLRIAGFATLGIAIFVFSAVVSSVTTVNVTIIEGNAAAVSYSINW